MPPRQRVKLSDQIREAMRDSGMSQARIARELATSETTISRFLSGQQGMGIEMLDRLADLLDLNIYTGKRRT